MLCLDIWWLYAAVQGVALGTALLTLPHNLSPQKQTAMPLFANSTEVILFWGYSVLQQQYLMHDLPLCISASFVSCVCRIPCLGAKLRTTCGMAPSQTRQVLHLRMSQSSQMQTATACQAQHAMQQAVLDSCTQLLA